MLQEETKDCSKIEVNLLFVDPQTKHNEVWGTLNTSTENDKLYHKCKDAPFNTNKWYLRNGSVILNIIGNRNLIIRCSTLAASLRDAAPHIRLLSPTDDDI